MTKEEKEKLKTTIESLAMDLKRVALGLHRGSFRMAERFKQEAFKRGLELESQPLNEYLKKLLTNTRKSLTSNTERTAEDALMYSTLLQNFTQKHF